MVLKPGPSPEDGEGGVTGIERLQTWKCTILEIRFAAYIYDKSLHRFCSFRTQKFIYYIFILVVVLLPA